MSIPNSGNPLGVPTTGEKAFIQPVLSSDGTIGGSSFAVTGSSNYAGGYWAAFDNNTGTRWHSSGGMPQWLTIYNPRPLKLKKFSIVTSNDSGHRGITSGNTQGSNDGSNWEVISSWTNSNTGQGASFEIQVNSAKFYKYYKLHIAGSAYGTWIGTCAVVAEIKIDAVTQAEFLY